MNTEAMNVLLTLKVQEVQLLKSLDQVSDPSGLIIEGLNMFLHKCPHPSLS